MENSIIYDIETLPPLPNTITKLQQECSKKNTSVKEISNIVQEDPLLSADIIKIANSPLYGFSNKISSITQAVSMFGISTIKGLAIASSVKSTLKINLEPYRLSTSQFVKASTLKSKLIYHWYKNDSEMLETLVPTALLMHTGMVIISDTLRKYEKDVEFSNELDENDFLSTEKRFLGLTQLDILELLFDHWNFEEKMINSIKYLKNNEFTEDFAKYIYPLQIINTVITPYQIASQEQIRQSIELIEKNNLDIVLFNEALIKIQNMES